ncbi:MAG: hypothetical protein A2X36_14860 [Elusimicrobia bacterium GWA2_69_24]|nr:MAG: hypothetical protein A2X36_14860 [Elusimicrobia bacterium GWA2_69_24]HBL19178.1 hypothetical protein [Elusimicrobiota bacterium]
MRGGELLESVRIPGEGAKLCLYKMDGEFAIWVENTELMNSLAHESEDALADLGCAGLKDAPASAVLIGGLGMGFTLAAALKRVGPGARVVVGELMSAVVIWNRGVLGHLAGNPLDDPRVTVQEGDVARILQTEENAFDAILLDVDNGPTGLVRDTNNWLYSEEGLYAAYTALRVNGVLAVWSSAPDRAFMMRLQKMGFAAEEHRIPVQPEFKDGHDTIWTARRL